MLMQNPRTLSSRLMDQCSSPVISGSLKTPARLFFVVLLLQSILVTSPLPIQASPKPKKLVGEYGPYFEGDILTDYSRISKRTVAQDSPGSGFADSGIITEHTEPYQPYWPGGRIPYKFDETASRPLPMEIKSSFVTAISWWQQVSCVQFVPATVNDTAYLNLTNKVGCSSYVGRIGRMQEVSIGIKRCKSPGNAAHELGHALGFWHEHTRTDRDQYIRVHYDNIKSDYTNNFIISNHEGVPDVGYDYQSIMHYEEDAFTKRDGLKTIEIRENVTIPECMAKMGQRRQLSHLDKLRMNKLYNCTVHVEELDGSGDPCPLVTTAPPTQATPIPTPTPTGPPAACGRKIIKHGDVIAFQAPKGSIWCESSCKSKLCDPRHKAFYGGHCFEERFKMYKVVNGKNKNIKNGDPIALESLVRENQLIDCRKGNCTLTTCNTNAPADANITQRICIHHRLRIFTFEKKEGKIIDQRNEVFFKHLDEEKYLNCLDPKGCKLITEGNCSNGSSSGSSGAGLCERQFFSLSKVGCQ